MKAPRDTAALDYASRILRDARELAGDDLDAFLANRIERHPDSPTAELATIAAELQVLIEEYN